MTGFHGVLPAVVTPFDAEGRFRPDSFERLLARVYEAGVHGLYVCGQTGEGMQQPLAQRKRVAEIAVKCSPAGKTVIVHVGAQSTADAIELARHASRIGAHAVSSLPPIGSYSFEEVRAYYASLAAASEVPLLIYYYPAVAPSIAGIDQILELCGIPNVAGLKFTDTDLFKLSQIKQHGAAVFSGCDEIFVAGLLMGADGGIGSFYNVVPGLFVQLYDLARAQRWQEARAVQQKVNELIAIGLRFPVHPAEKVMLSWLGIDCGRCLAPRRWLSAGEEAELRELLGKSVFEADFAGARA